MKLIIIDSGNISHKSIFSYIAQIKKEMLDIAYENDWITEPDEKGNINILEEHWQECYDLVMEKIRKREVVIMFPVYTYFKMIISYLKKLGTTLEDKILVCQDFGSWRKAVDKEYKAQRKEFRESFMPNWWWDKTYKEFNDFIPKLENSLPFYFPKIYKCEADDLASVAIRFIDAEDKILISSDEDWQMLCSIPNTKIFSPYTKAFKIIKNPEKILLKKIKGDKCLEGHVPIVLANSMRKMIKDLNPREEVATYNFKTHKIESNKIQSIGKSYSKKRRFIYFDKEKVPLKTTLEHPLFTKRGWIKAKNIRCSDMVYKYNELKYMIKTCIPHNFYKLGYLHGYLIGDGSVSKFKEITYTSVDLDGLNRIKSYMFDLFRKKLDIVIAKKINHQKNRQQVYEINIKSELKDNFFKYFMLLISKGYFIIRRQYYRGFVAGFFDAEGSCSPKILNLKNGGQRIVWSVVFSNTNKKYIDYICNCLKLFNINSKIYKKILLSKKYIYKIELTETTKNINFFILFRPAIKRKYPDLTILSNGKRVRTVKTVIAKKDFEFINYNITTRNHNFFANDVLVHNSDNLLSEPQNIQEYNIRKKIVDLLHLPEEIERPIKDILLDLPVKQLYLEKIPFPSCRKAIQELYGLK
jgi:hypothetical protein